MKIELKEMEQPSEGVAVGLLDGQPLVFHGRTATAGGREYASKEIAEEILAAVEHAAREVFGPEWVQALALVTAMNPRTCQRDRIARYGLPAPALRLLGEAMAEPWPRAMGDVLQACARMLKSNALEGRVGPPAGQDVAIPLDLMVRRARDIVHRLRAERDLHRAPALESE